jgi:hypothetical protein
MTDPMKVSARFELDARVQADLHEREAHAIELEAAAERDPATGRRPRLVDRVRLAVEHLPHRHH